MTTKNFLLFLFLFFGLENVRAQTPDWQWAKGLGGNTGFSAGESITTDAAGNVFLTGHFQGTVDFDPGPGVTNLISAGQDDIFIAKYDAAGNLIWAHSIGGPSWDSGSSIITDAAGNIYLTGKFVDTVDFNPGLAVYNLYSGGLWAPFICKFTNGGILLWAKVLAGVNTGYGGETISLDTSGTGAVIIGGSFIGTVDFDPGIGVFNLTSTDGDAFILKLDLNGYFIWARQLMGHGWQNINSIVADSDGDVYATGVFEDTCDFDPGPGLQLLMSNGQYDFFVLKLSNTGLYEWVRTVGGTHIDYPFSIALDDSENVLITGSFADTAVFNSGWPFCTLVSEMSSSDIFIYKLESNGNFIWAYSLGTLQNEAGTSIRADHNGNIYLIGQCGAGMDFDPGPGVYLAIGNGGFTAKYNNDCELIWCKNQAYPSCCNGYMYLDAETNVYVTGGFTLDTMMIGNFMLVNPGTNTEAIYFAKLGTCSSEFFLFPDTTLAHHYFAVNRAMGIPPLQYDWSWGDGAHDYTAFPSHVYADSGYYDICLSITDSVGCSSTHCDSSFYLVHGTSSSSMVYVNVVDEIVMSIPDGKEHHELLISPNPANDKITIHSSSEKIYSIEIFSFNGSMVFSDHSSSTFIELNLTVENWDPGIYFIKVQTENGSSVQKLIIQ